MYESLHLLAISCYVVLVGAARGGFCRAWYVLQNPAGMVAPTGAGWLVVASNLGKESVCYAVSVEFACLDVVFSLKLSLLVRSKVETDRDWCNISLNKCAILFSFSIVSNVKCLTGWPEWVVNCTRGVWAAGNDWSILMIHFVGENSLIMGYAGSKLLNFNSKLSKVATTSVFLNTLGM